MQDPLSTTQFQPLITTQKQEEEAVVKCPRCESANTKFCYYNNYNLLQPRHFCKNCRRYWTKGGSLRNIPVGGGSRKNSKRASSETTTTTTTSSSSSGRNPKRHKTPPVSDPKPEPVLEPVDKMLEISGSFSSLLESNGQFGNFLDGLGAGTDADTNLQWNNGWTDLAIFTSPGSGFQ